MKIFIPTYGRADKQVTLENLPPSLQKRTILVLQSQDSREHRDTYEEYCSKFGCDLWILPPRIKTISPTRQYIMSAAHKAKIQKLVMLDDDLKFDTRRKDDPTKFLTSTSREITQLFKRIEKELDNYYHVGVLAREGGNRVTEDITFNTRMMRVLAYDVGFFSYKKIKFDRVPLQEDFDVTLQLLRKGYPNAVLCGWVQGQGSSNAEGGCSHFRTIELHNENAEKLQKLHPDFVTVVEKETKGAWNGQPRLDVRVQWKKAYESSL